MTRRKNNPSEIWFLTAVVTYESLKIRKMTRTFGYHLGWTAALKAVNENHGNMHECLYNYLVMERIGNGIHALVEDFQWFKWSGKKWKPCNKPAWAQGITNWAIG